MTDTFPGFRKPDHDFFRLPNEWTDVTAGINNLAELKVVEYILRHTWGYQNYGELISISTDEFMNGRKKKDNTRMDKGTGLSDRAIKNGIALAIEHGYIICVVDDHDKARIKKYYGLKMLDRNNLPIGGNNLPIPDRNNLPVYQEQCSYPRWE